MFGCVFFLSATVKGLRTREQQGIHSFTVFIKVVDSCWISSTEWSDTFRSFFVYGKKQE